MKTTKDTQKTDRNVRMVVLRASAVIFSLVLISLTTVSAQDFLKQLLTNSSYGKMASISVEKPSEFKEADAAIEAINAEFTEQLINSTETFAFESETDENMEVEVWMTNEALFNANSVTITEEADDDLNLEDWMINSTNFKTNSLSVINEADAAIELEGWMITDLNFASNDVITERDNDLSIEKWMTDDRNFVSVVENKPLELQAWMSDNRYWGF